MTEHDVLTLIGELAWIVIYAWPFLLSLFVMGVLLKVDR